jgi:CoA transferase family III
MSETELWAASGAMALTGRRDGPALLGTGSPATAVQAALDVLARAGVPRLPDVRLLGERAAAAGYERDAPRSAGGGFRILRARDGWFGVSLARPADLELVPALVGREVHDPWGAVAEWLDCTTVSDATSRTRLLGLPAATVAAEPPPPTRDGVLVTDGGSRLPTERPLVIDLSSLWAGPLCAHLLGLAGARVVKVESSTRLDGARRGPAAFYDLLHAGHESVVIDFADQRPLLHELIERADVVIEASRPRALQHLGVDARAEVKRGAAWVSITAGGREDATRVGFGDDVAAGAGLVAWEAGLPCPMGDALADPLAGVAAAAAAVTALAHCHGALIDVSMHDICAAAARTPPTGPRHVDPAPPTPRTASGPARPPGADTDRILAELLGA